MTKLDCEYITYPDNGISNGTWAALHNDFDTYAYDKDTVGRIYLHDAIERNNQTQDIQRDTTSLVPPKQEGARVYIDPEDIPHTEGKDTVSERGLRGSDIPLIKVKWK